MANEKRLIDANAVDYENIMCSMSQLHWLNAIIEKQPTVDAVEVVRCGKCRKRAKGEYGMCHILCRQTHEDDFCSYGERREGD